MSYFLSPIGNDQQCDANGNPLVGGGIYTYLAGTSTPAATYTDNTGGTPQANPIVLNSLGLPTSPVWLLGGVTYKFIIKDSGGSTIHTIDNVAGINDSTVTVSDWVSLGVTPTYLSATSFSVTGDQTALLEVGRRVKSSNTGGTAYSTINSSSYSAGITTVTLKNDSLTLDSGLSAVSYGLVSAVNPSLPNSLVTRSTLGIVTNWPIKTGRYYNPAIVVVPSGTGVPGGGTTYYIPYIQTETRSMAAISVSVTTGAAGNVRLGLYTNNDGLPAALIATAGTASTAATGIKDIAYTTLIPTGFYWLAFQHDAAATFRMTNWQGVAPPFGNTFGVGTDFTSANTTAFYTEAVAYAAGLPATATPTAGFLGTSVPVIFVKA